MSLRDSLRSPLTGETPTKCGWISGGRAGLVYGLARALAASYSACQRIRSRIARVITCR